MCDRSGKRKMAFLLIGEQKAEAKEKDERGNHRHGREVDWHTRWTRPSPKAMVFVRRGKRCSIGFSLNLRAAAR
jgi:hypothetical protein